MVKNISLIALGLQLSIATLTADDMATIRYAGGDSYALSVVPSITLENEILQIDLYQDHFSVIATLELYNAGDPIDVLIGFPQMVSGGSTQDSGGVRIANEIYAFSTTTDGVEEIVEEIDVDIPITEKTDYRINKLFTRSISFGKGQRRILVDRYHSTYKWHYGDSAKYLFGTASSWGGIDRLKIVVINRTDNYMFWEIPSFEGTVTYDRIYEKAYQTPRSQGRTYQAEFENVRVNLNATFSILIQRSGFFGLPWDYNYDKKVYSRLAFELLTMNQLQAARNLIYAWHGYTFLRPNWREMFLWREIFQKENWYKPNLHFSESDFCAKERHNLSIIRAVEEERAVLSR